MRISEWGMIAFKKEEYPVQRAGVQSEGKGKNLTYAGFSDKIKKIGSQAKGDGQYDRSEKNLHGRDNDMCRRAADAYGSGISLSCISGYLDHTFRDRASFLSLGEVFLAGRCLKEDEFSHAGEKVKRFQVIPGKLAGQNSGPLQRGKVLVDNDQISTGKLASSAVNGNFFIRQAFIADSNFQQGGKIFQMLEERSF